MNFSSSNEPTQIAAYQQQQQQQQQHQHQQQQVFGLIIPGKEVVTNFTPTDPSGTKFALTIPFDVSTSSQNSNKHNPITSISDLVFFLLPNITLPPNSGAMIYWSAAGTSASSAAQTSSFELLGALTPNQPSVILRTGWSTHEPLQNLINNSLSSAGTTTAVVTVNLTFGISLEPLDNVRNTLHNEENNMNDTKNVAQKIACDLFNYLQSFDDTGDASRSGWMTVPTNVFDRWFKRFESKIARDPNFFMKNSN
mmetsp:Transcript_20323/g.23559  ORF Transcript_20323/g.23559 Transcript_20323/m.23559 type:complete len:253 (+) Transcript_20323:152-910(+)